MACASPMTPAPATRCSWPWTGCSTSRSTVLRSSWSTKTSSRARQRGRSRQPAAVARRPAGLPGQRRRAVDGVRPAVQGGLWVRPEVDGEITAARKLGARQGQWANVWRRFAEMPHRYPGSPSSFAKPALTSSSSITSTPGRRTTNKPRTSSQPAARLRGADTGRRPQRSRIARDGPRRGDEAPCGPIWIKHRSPLRSSSSCRLPRSPRTPRVERGSCFARE